MINLKKLHRPFQLVLHLALLFIIVINITPIINHYIPGSQDCKKIHDYSLQIVCLSTIFFLITMQWQQKVHNFALTSIILCTLFNMLLSAACIHRHFMIYTFGPLPTSIELILLTSSKMGFLALLIYISGFINKKLFWSLATCSLLYMLSVFIYYWDM